MRSSSQIQSGSVLSKVSSGNHCRSDPVQVQSTMSVTSLPEVATISKYEGRFLSTAVLFQNCPLPKAPMSFDHQPSQWNFESCLCLWTTLDCNNRIYCYCTADDCIDSCLADLHRKLRCIFYNLRFSLSDMGLRCFSVSLTSTSNWASLALKKLICVWLSQRFLVDCLFHID